MTDHRDNWTPPPAERDPGDEPEQLTIDEELDSFDTWIRGLSVDQDGARATDEAKRPT